MRLLDNRAQSLAELPEGSFRFEVSRLGQAIAGLKPTTDATRNPDYSYDDVASYVEQRNKAEQLGLTPPQQAVIERLRALGDVEQVASDAANLPAELRLYAVGAAAFNAGDHQRAVESFQQLLALPAEERRLRSTWAAYSLGRALFAMATEAGRGEPAVLQDQARQAFRQARELSIAGFSDPLELGVASLGEEARVAYTADDWNSAIELYATQNLQGSPVGYSSLLQLASNLRLESDGRLKELLKAKAVQRLATAYLLSRVGWWDGEEPSGEKELVKLLQAWRMRTAWQRSVINTVITAAPRPSSIKPRTLGWPGGYAPNWPCATATRLLRRRLMPRPPRHFQKRNPGVIDARRTGTTKRFNPSAGSKAKVQSLHCSAATTCKRSISFIVAATIIGTTPRQSPSAC
jgi:tetratricopeptide (TPR) repeat protein